MKMRCLDFESLSKDIQNNNNKIVMFGAGVVGGIIAPQILNRYEILSYVDCYIDNDSTRWGSKLKICGREIQINSPKYLDECDSNTVIMLNISRYSGALDQLRNMSATQNMICYIFPMLCVHNYCLSESHGEAKLTKSPIIPKKIHYMWLGRKQLPDNLKRCIDSWRRYCPDYEIIEWNEDNYDIDKNIYMKEAYQVGGYGFVPDYARLDILYNHGGIYMDTDEELFRSLDDMLYQEAFCGVEKWQDISFGACAGAVPGHPMIKKFLDARKNMHFVNPDGSYNKNTCGFYDTPTALEEGYLVNGRTQSVKGLNIYGYDYFVPYDYMTGTCNRTNNTYSVHWYNGGWLDEEKRVENEKTASKYEKIYNMCINGAVI